MQVKKVVVCLVGYLLLCGSIFLCFQKPIFMLYNWAHGASACTFADWCRIYRHGIALDFATSAYLTLFPFIIVLIYSALPPPPFASVCFRFVESGRSIMA